MCSQAFDQFYRSGNKRIIITPENKVRTWGMERVEFFCQAEGVGSILARRTTPLALGLTPSMTMRGKGWRRSGSPGQHLITTQDGK